MSYFFTKTLIGVTSSIRQLTIMYQNVQVEVSIVKIHVRAEQKFLSTSAISPIWRTSAKFPEPPPSVQPKHTSKSHVSRKYACWVKVRGSAPLLTLEIQNYSIFLFDINGQISFYRVVRIETKFNFEKKLKLLHTGPLEIQQFIVRILPTSKKSELRLGLLA